MVYSLDPFRLGNAFSRSEYRALGDPIQDTVGSLYTSLMMLRTCKIVGLNECSISGELSLRTRLQIAAILTCAHKLCTSSRKNGHNIMISFIQALSLPWELPDTFHDWEKIISNHEKMEVEVALSLPGISVLTESPLHYVEITLYCLVMDRRVEAAVATVLRGGAFFFIGALMLNDHDQFEMIMKLHGSQTLGEATAYLLAACFAASKKPPRKFKLSQTKDHDTVASVLLDNATSPHATCMRVGVYADDKQYKMLSRRILYMLKPVFDA